MKQHDRKTDYTHNSAVVGENARLFEELRRKINR